MNAFDLTTFFSLKQKYFSNNYGCNQHGFGMPGRYYSALPSPIGYCQHIPSSCSWGTCQMTCFSRSKIFSRLYIYYTYIAWKISLFSIRPKNRSKAGILTFFSRWAAPFPNAARPPSPPPGQLIIKVDKWNRQKDGDGMLAVINYKRDEKVKIRDCMFDSMLQ